MDQSSYFPMMGGKATGMSGEAQDPLIHGRAHTRARRLAHEVKNFMSVLLLGLANLEHEGDHWKISAHEREVFEDAVLEINRLVEAVVDLTRENAIGATVEKTARLRSRQEAAIGLVPLKNPSLRRSL